MEAAEPSGGTLLAPPVVLLDEELVVLLVPTVVLGEVVAPMVVPIVPPPSGLPSESSPQPKARPRRKTLATHSVNRMAGAYGGGDLFSKQTRAMVAQERGA